MPNDQTAREVVAYLHRMHMEGGQTNDRLTFSAEHPWGRPDIDYSAEYEITTTPLGSLAALPSRAEIERETIEREGFLAVLRRVNTDRYHAWVGDGQDAGILFDAAELGGEVGELLNVVKKLEREERGWRGSRAAPEDFADECADVLICLDKLARRRGVDLEAATVAKFNATSEKVGLPHRLPAIRALPAASEGDEE